MIQVVEDEALIALGLIGLLEEQGHTVNGPAASYTQAIAQAEAAPPHLAFVDLNLLDGPMGVRVARELANRFGTLVVVVSATPEGVEEGVGGVFRVIRKPYRDQSILETVERASIQRRQDEARAARLQASPSDAIKRN